eukprot:9257366-Alexandrium_andersonii.AAC.1
MLMPELHALAGCAKPEATAPEARQPLELTRDGRAQQLRATRESLSPTVPWAIQAKRAAIEGGPSARVLGR